jgi:hypothetical protein
MLEVGVHDGDVRPVRLAQAAHDGRGQTAFALAHDDPGSLGAGVLGGRVLRRVVHDENLVRNAPQRLPQGGQQRPDVGLLVVRRDDDGEQGLAQRGFDWNGG